MTWTRITSKVCSPSNFSKVASCFVSRTSRRIPWLIVTCAKQTYTGARKLKTSQPKFNERFVFYNVLPDVDPLRIEIRGFEVSLGFVEIDVALVRENVMMKDTFKLQGVAKGEIELLLQYAPMAAKKAVDRSPEL